MNPAGEVIRARHLERLAVVYVRQSTPAQVVKNTESARLQYALRDLARQWGWPPERTETIDEDQGITGSGDEHRSGFARLTLMVARGDVGVVLGLDSTRVSRNTAEWFELLRWLRLTDTLFASACAKTPSRDEPARPLELPALPQDRDSWGFSR